MLMDDADLSYPIILASDGAVMDEMHRVAKAVRQGHTNITLRYHSSRTRRQIT
jgi:hypothetical protein